jgi:two-component system KDP operon response regulator KdpE
VRAVLKRAGRKPESVNAPGRCGEIEMEYARYGVRARGQSVALTRTEFALLRELMVNANRVVLHQDLLTKVWGAEYRDDLEYLRAYIRYLRRKLEADPAQPHYILTVPGIGYMLKCPETGAGS